MQKTQVTWKKHGQAEIKEIYESVEKNFDEPNNLWKKVSSKNNDS